MINDFFLFCIVNFPFFDGVVPRCANSCYISQLIRLIRASIHVSDFNIRNKYLTAKFLK